MRVGTIARKVTRFHRAMKKFLAAKALIIVLPSRGYLPFWVPRTRIIVCWGLYWGPILGNYLFSFEKGSVHPPAEGRLLAVVWQRQLYRLLF